MLLAQLPSSTSSLRVSLWRRMKAAGALSLQNGAWLLPASPRNRQLLQETLAYLRAEGGSSSIFEAKALEPGEETLLIDRFKAGAGEEYAEFCERCAALLGEISRESEQRKFTFAELDEGEEELQKLVSWLRKIRARDFFQTRESGQATASLEACRIALKEFENRVYQNEGLQPPDSPTGDRDV